MTLGLPHFNIYQNKEFECQHLLDSSFFSLASDDLFDPNITGIEGDNKVNWYEYQKLDFLCRAHGYYREIEAGKR